MSVQTVPNSDAERVVTVLLVSSFEYDHIYFDSLFSRTKWNLFRAHTSSEALQILRNHVVPIVIADETAEPSGWIGMLEETQLLPYRPKLIVASLLATDGTWADVLNLGGYDVLMRPLEQEEVLHSISMGWLSWKYSAEREDALARKSSGMAGLLVSSTSSGVALA